MVIELEGLVTEAKARQIEQEKFISYITDFANIALIHATGDPVNDYIFTFNLNAYRPTPDGIKVGKPHIIQITLPAEYPQTPPQVRALTPLCHPAVNPANGVIDIDKLWASFSAPSLQKLVGHLARMIPGGIYQTPDPVNPEAVQWYEEHAADLPLDVPVRVKAEESGAGADEDLDLGDPYAPQIKLIGDLLKRNHILIAAKELASLPPDLGFPERDEVEQRIRMAQKATNKLVAQINELEEIRRLVAKNQIYALAGRMAGLSPNLWFPERDDILAGIEQAKTESRRLFTKALSFEKQGEYGKALGYAQAVLRYIPDHPEAKDLIDRLQQEHDLQLSDAEEVDEDDPENPLAVGIKHKRVDVKNPPVKLVKTKKIEEEEAPPEKKSNKKPDKKAAKKAPKVRKPRKPLNLPKLPENFPWKRILFGVTGILCLTLLGALGWRFMDERTLLQGVEQAIAQSGTQMQAKQYVPAKSSLERARADLAGLTLLGFKKRPLAQRIDDMLAQAQKGIAEQRRLEEQKRLEEEERLKKEAEELAAAQERERLAAEAEAQKREGDQEQPEAARGISPEDLQKEEDRLQEAMDAVLPDAKRAFEERRWKDAADLYQRVLDLARDSLPELQEKMTDFLGQVEHIRDLARVQGPLDEAETAAGTKDWASVIRLKNEAIAAISKSRFAQEAEFVGLKKQLQEQVNEHKQERALVERTASLEARGINYIIKSFPNYKKEHLSQPKAKFLRRDGSRHIYELSVVDKSQGRPSRLSMLFAYDEKTKKWEQARQ